MALSNRTKTTPVSGELATTEKDMDELDNWEFGDPEPTGTHAKNYTPHRRLRNDLRRGKSDARNYDNNVIFINTFGTVSEQLDELR